LKCSYEEQNCNIVIKVNKIDTLMIKDIENITAFTLMLKYCYNHKICEGYSGNPKKGQMSKHEFLKHISVDDLLSLSELSLRFMLNGLQKLII
jgi:hypothetical protein